MPELDELMSEIPADILGDGEEATPTAPAGGENEPDEEGDELNEPAGTDLGGTKTKTAPAAGDEDDEEEAGDEDEPGTPTDEEDDDDFITSLDEDEEPTAPVTPEKPVTTQPTATDENSYILSQLQKIAVRVVMPGEKEGENVVKTVEVYGYGDLPREYLGFATPYEAGIFNQQVVAQENKAREAQTQYRNNQMKADMDEYTRKENTAIAEDLTELRREGLFPKFKGNPGTKEFNDSEGAKEFDKVIAFMNKRNTEYQRRAQNGGAYRHIGFREAYDMLHGPNPKAAEKAEQKGRKAAAARTVTSRGTKSSQRNVSSKPVQNITDLASEFEAFAGQGASS